MTTESIAKRLVVEMIVMMLFLQVYSKSSSSFDLNKKCTRQNGTVCNLTPPDECSFEGRDPAHERHTPAVNIETIFIARILDSSTEETKRQRYLNLEWTPESGIHSDPTFVRVTQQQLNGRVLQDHVICMSNFGKENNANEQIPGLDLKSLARQSTLVPLIDRVTAVWVEIKTSKALSQYRVDIARFERHSWILQAVAITVHKGSAYISISPPDIRRLESLPGAMEYSLTMICYTVIKGGNYTYNENWSSLNISARDVTSTNCTKTRKEIPLSYISNSKQALIYKMNHMAYGLAIDAELYNVRLNYVVNEASLRTLLFRTTEPISEEDHTRRSVGSSNHLEIIEFNSTPINRDPEVNKENASIQYLSSASQFSASLSKNDQSATENRHVIIWGTVGTCIVLLSVAVGVFVTFRHRKISQNSMKIRTPEKYDTIKDHKNSNGKSLLVASDKKPSVTLSKKFQVTSECCENQNSDTTSNDNVSNLLIFLSNSSLNSAREDSDEDGISEQDANWDEFSVIEPKIFNGSSRSLCLEIECLKINRSYERLNGNINEMSLLGSCDILTDDECFSIDGSVAC